jgi:hypothetical protein
MSLTGSRFSSGSAPRPFHHGIRRRGGTIFWATLPSMCQADMRTHRLLRCINVAIGTKRTSQDVGPFVRFRGEADIQQRGTSRASVANDPQRTYAGPKSRSAAAWRVALACYHSVWTRQCPQPDSEHFRSGPRTWPAAPCQAERAVDRPPRHRPGHYRWCLPEGEEGPCTQ